MNLYAQNKNSHDYAYSNTSHAYYILLSSNKMNLSANHPKHGIQTEKERKKERYINVFYGQNWPMR